MLSRCRRYHRFLSQAIRGSSRKLSQAESCGTDTCRSLPLIQAEVLSYKKLGSVATLIINDTEGTNPDESETVEIPNESVPEGERPNENETTEEFITSTEPEETESPKQEETKPQEQATQTKRAPAAKKSAVRTADSAQRQPRQRNQRRSPTKRTTQSQDEQ